MPPQLSLLSILENIIDESPLGIYQTIGDFEKGKSFNDPRDRSSVKNPKTIEKLQNLLKNTTVDFDLYFVNKPNLRMFSELGNVDWKFIVSPYPDGLGLNREEITIDDEKITVFFVSNLAAQKIPMTAWTIAHRIGHAMNETYSFRQYTDWVDKEFEKILALYNIKNPRAGNLSGRIDFRKFELAKGRLFNAVGTMRSARENKLHQRHFEFYFELFVQSLMLNEHESIKFNPLPKKLLVGIEPYGRKTLAHTENLSDAQDILDNISNTLPYYVNDVLLSNVGEIFVM